MHDHSSSVYNNNCIKAPRNPKNDHPQTQFDQKFLNDLHNEVTKNFSEKMKTNLSDLSRSDVKTFIDFYDSIPEYDDINHLSNREFYKKLDNLKEKQREFCDYLNRQLKFDVKDTAWIDDYKNLQLGDRNLSAGSRKKSSIKSFCGTPIPKKSPLGKYLDDENISLSDKDIPTKPPSRRSVRIETPSMKSSPDLTPEPYFRSKTRFRNVTPEDQKIPNHDWDDLMADDLNLISTGNTPLPLETKSAPNSPLRTRKMVENDDKGYDGITVPKPFQMTVRLNNVMPGCKWDERSKWVRDVDEVEPWWGDFTGNTTHADVERFAGLLKDEENKIVDELLLKINKPKEEKHPLFKAHDVPIESQIPLFDKIMEDQQRRSQKVKEKRKADLQAQMRPFSFTRRDEEIQELTKTFSKSLPCVYNDDVPMKIKKFKAKPIPRNLFSNYIYKKMHEDEFYRTLQKKVRAEEMLKHASLPPSMAKREKSNPKIDVCPRSYRDLSTPENRNTPLKKNKKIPNYKAYHDKYERELEELKNEFISTSPRPFKLKSCRRDKRSRKNYYRISSATSKSSSETRTPSSLDMSSINRSNLAAVLRIQSARQRLEMEMTRKLEEAKLKEEARWREKLMRKKPVWQALAYSHEEDLAMRLQLRRDEEKLRNEEHRLRMELMLGRVNQQPTLFERQSQIKFPTTKEELIGQLYKEYKVLGTKKKSRPKSGLSDSSDLRTFVEMKDEAIQAIVDEKCLRSAEEFGQASRRNSKESEECECLAGEVEQK